MKAESLLALVLRDERGATAVEYGLIVAMIVLAMVGALSSVADNTTGMWDLIDEKITGSE